MGVGQATRCQRATGASGSPPATTARVWDPRRAPVGRGGRRERASSASGGAVVLLRYFEVKVTISCVGMAYG